MSECMTLVTCETAHYLVLTLYSRERLGWLACFVSLIQWSCQIRSAMSCLPG